jgi:catechol 2,3-dioxygenase-like lactoylglutathione lyase family enzyme
LAFRPNDARQTTRVNQVGTVLVPVADQQRALEFYVGKLGFEKRADFRYGEGGRWIEVPRQARRAQSRSYRRARASPPAATRLAAPFRDTEGNRFLIVQPD